MHTSTEMMYQRKYSRASITMYLHADRSIDTEMNLQGFEGLQSIRDRICGARFVEVRGTKECSSAWITSRSNMAGNGGDSNAWLFGRCNGGVDLNVDVEAEVLPRWQCICVAKSFETIGPFPGRCDFFQSTHWTHRRPSSPIPIHLNSAAMPLIPNPIRAAWPAAPSLEA